MEILLSPPFVIFVWYGLVFLRQLNLVLSESWLKGRIMLPISWKWMALTQPVLSCNC